MSTHSLAVMFIAEGLCDKHNGQLIILISDALILELFATIESIDLTSL